MFVRNCRSRVWAWEAGVGFYRLREHRGHVCDQMRSLCKTVDRRYEVVLRRDTFFNQRNKIFTACGIPSGWSVAQTSWRRRAYVYEQSLGPPDPRNPSKVMGGPGSGGPPGQCIFICSAAPKTHGLLKTTVGTLPRTSRGEGSQGTNNKRPQIQQGLVRREGFGARGF
jgi:hypothetical protein